MRLFLLSIEKLYWDLEWIPPSLYVVEFVSIVWCPAYPVNIVLQLLPFIITLLMLLPSF
jgi:hypothetical protein